MVFISYGSPRDTLNVKGFMQNASPKYVLNVLAKRKMHRL
jgi:hypothetical protein